MRGDGKLKKQWKTEICYDTQVVTYLYELISSPS